MTPADAAPETGGGPRTEAGDPIEDFLDMLPGSLGQDRGLTLRLYNLVGSERAEAARKARAAIRDEIAAKVHAEADRRIENSAYMLDDCDGTTPLGEDHEAKGFRRSDCLTCNGENNQTRFQTWPDAMFAVLAVIHAEETTP